MTKHSSRTTTTATRKSPRRKSNKSMWSSPWTKRLVSVLVVVGSVGVLTNRLQNFLGLIQNQSDIMTTTSTTTTATKSSPNNAPKLLVSSPTVSVEERGGGGLTDENLQMLSQQQRQAASTTTTITQPPEHNNNNNNAAGSDNTVPPNDGIKKQSMVLPDDWSEVLRLRAEALRQQQKSQQQKELQQQHQVPVGGDPPPPQGGDPLLARSDALYQKGTWDKAPIIIEKYKLVFFTVPKVGCTAFKQLFRRMMGFSNWQDHQYYREPFLPHNPSKNGLKYLSDFPFEKANEMLTSPEWTRAIFVRDPKERALSSFLDKAAYSKGYYLRMRCCPQFSPESEQYQKLQCATGAKQYSPPEPGEVNAPIVSFEEFLTQIIPHCPDPHWETQATRMAPKYWDQITFVGRFETIYEDTKALLTQLGDAWDVYGSTGWTTADGRDGAIFDPSQKAKHGTNAQDKSSSEQYFTPEAILAIRKYYALDYGQHKVLKFAPPTVS